MYKITVTNKPACGCPVVIAVYYNSDEQQGIENAYMTHGDNVRVFSEPA